VEAEVPVHGTEFIIRAPMKSLSDVPPPFYGHVGFRGDEDADKLPVAVEGEAVTLGVHSSMKYSAKPPG